MKKILVAVDLQNDFVTGPLGNDDTRLAARNSVDLVGTGWFDHIVFTRDTHGPDYLDTLEGRKLPVTHCVEGTPGWEIIPEFGLRQEGGDGQMPPVWRCDLPFPGVKNPECTIVDKCTFGSLVTPRNCCLNMLGAIRIKSADGGSFELDDYREAMELHFCGVCTSICVLSNMCLCRAAYPNTRIVLHTKATGDVDEASKQAAFKVLENIQCDLEE